MRIGEIKNPRSIGGSLKVNKNSSEIMRKTPLVTCILIACVLGLTACGDKDCSAAQAKKGGDKAQLQAAPPLPAVGVVIAQPKTVAMVTELPGRVEAFRVAQVRARAAGILEKRLFEEGSDVKAGQLLMRIDDKPYLAALQSAKASLLQAQAGLDQAKATVERYRPLVGINAISKLEFENAEATYKAALAQVEAAKAAVLTAKINFDYTKVTAPISGRIGRALVTEGALVGQGAPTELAVIQQIGKVYVNFTQSTTDAQRLRSLMQKGALQKIDGKNSAKVDIVLEDGTLHSSPGKLLFTDLTVDPTSGQVTMRAEVPNQDKTLLPGMYVRARIEQAQIANAIALPQQAVERSDNGDTVTIIDKDGNRIVQPVKVHAASGNEWLIEEGLKGGEQIMVDGFQALQMMPPGVKVKAVPWEKSGDTKEQKEQEEKKEQKTPPLRAQPVSDINKKEGGK